MDYFYPIIGLCGGSYYMYYYGFDKLKNYLITTILEHFKDKNSNTTSFKQFGKSKSAIVLFNYMGKQSKLYIPYDRTKMSKMIRKKVFLIMDKEIEERIDITHKPGVPYLISPQKMGGIKIVVEKDNIIIQTYELNDIPNYLE